MNSKPNCKDHTEYGRHRFNSLCPFAENDAQHTEDCLDANDDTSVLKGKCICPK